MPALLSVQGVSKRFGEHRALSDVSLQVEQGEFVALLGPSGCGKTTLLRAIAGFLAPDAGSIAIDGRDVVALAPHRRPLNTVFQNYALFPHMTVLENVAYGPRRQGAPRAQAHERAREALAMVGLQDHGQRYPRQLSGGQQQRVALARAIVNRPRLLLLDEPLSALDLKLRKRMQLELKHLQERLGIAFIFVTHDQEEAMAMADRIVVMNAGRIEQAGPGDEIYRAPATRFVAEFIGEANLMNGRPVAGGLQLWPDGPVVPQADPVACCAMLRPEHLELLPVQAQAPQDKVVVEATVEDVVSLGSHTTVYVRAGAQPLAVRQAGMPEARPAPGSRVRVAFAPQRLHRIQEGA